MAVIAEGDIRVNLQDAGAKRELKALTADVKRTFEQLDNAEAHPRVELEHKDFQRAYQQVQRQLDKLKSERARAIARLDIKGFQEATAKLAVLDRKLRAIDGKRYTALMKVDVDRDAARTISEFERTLQRLGDTTFFRNLRGKVGIDLDESDLRRVEQEIEGTISKLQRRKATLVLESDSTGVAQTAAEIENLRRLLGRVQQETNRVKADVRRDPLTIPIELDRRELRELENQLIQTINRMKKEKLQLRIEGDIDGVRRITNDLDQLDQDLVAIRRRRIEIKLDYDRNVFKNFFRDLKSGNVEGFAHTIGSVSKAWNEFGGSVLGAGVRLGPLTLRLRTAITVMTVLAPLLTSLGGGVVALASAIYTGLLGALGPATAGVGALAIGLGGIAGVLVPLIGDFGKAQKAVTAYDKAVRENGKDSDQAKNKLEQLQNVMGNVGPSTRDAVRDVGKLGGEWRKLTSGARPAFFNTLADGIRTARSLMPLFARESVATFEAAAGGVRKWLAGLRGGEARNIFRSLFKGAQESIPNLQAALGNIGTFLGRIAQAAMPLWNEFTQTLERWTKGWADGAKNGDKVRDFLLKTKDALVDVAQFTGALARLFHNLFMGGSQAGQGFLQTLTDLMNRWADFLGTTRGQNELHDFLSNAVNITVQFARILGDIGKVFFSMAQQLAPVTKVIFAITEAISNLIAQSSILKSLFTGLVLGAIFLRALAPILKVVAALNALKLAFAAAAGAQGAQRLVAGLSTLGAAYRQGRGLPGGAVPGALSTVGAEAGGAAGGAAAGSRLAAGHDKAAGAGKKLLVVEKGVAREVGAAGVAAGVAGGRLALLGRAAAVATGPIGLTALAVGTLTYAAVKLGQEQAPGINSLENLQSVLKNLPAAAKNAAQAQGQLSAAGIQYRGAVLGVRQAEQQVNALRKAGKTGTDEYANAVLQLESALQNEKVSEQQLNQVSRQAEVNAHARAELARERLRLNERAGSSEQVLAKLRADVAKAENAEISAAVNITRARRGLAAVTGEAAQKMGFYIKTFAKLPKGDVVRKFFVQADTKQAEAGIRNISRLQKAGVQDSTIIRILASTDDAELQLAKLRALVKNLPDGNVNIDAKDNASNKARRARSLIQALTQTFMSIFQARDGTSGSARNALKNALRLVRPFLSALRANDGASPVIRGVLGLLSAVDGRVATSTIRTIHETATRNAGAVPRTPGGKVRAMGGTIPKIRGGIGGRVMRATFVAGEENRDEFVVATNPAYRRRNRRIVKAAANALGIRDLNDVDDVRNTLEKDDDRLYDFPAYKKGKGPSKATKRRQRKAARRFGSFKRKWTGVARDEQRRLEAKEKDIKDAVQKRDQDETQFNIDLDNNPIVKERPSSDPEAEAGDVEDYVDEGARAERLGKIKNLMNQTTAILTQYDNLKTAIKRAIERIAEARTSVQKKLEGITRRKVGKDNRSKLREDYKQTIADLGEDIGDARERLHEIGDRDTRGEQRSETLQYQQYESDRRQTTALTVAQRTTKDTSGPTADETARADQAVAQAAASERRAGIAESALRAFGGSGDIGAGSRTAFQAAVGAILSPRSGLPGIDSIPTLQASQIASQTLSGGATPASQAPSEGAGGGGPNITIQTLHPADPATLDAIGRAATGGISLQGASISPREISGL